MICADCKKEISKQYMHFFVAKKNDWYCYDCYQKYRRKKNVVTRKKKKPDPLNAKIRNLYGAKWKPSEIAQELNIPVTEVYERLTNKGDE